MSKKVKRRFLTTTIFLINGFIFFFGIVVFLVFNNNTIKRVYDENVSNIVNINNAASQSTYFSLSNQRLKVSDLRKYLNSNSLSLEKAIEYIEDSTADESPYTFAIIDKTNKGRLVDSEIINVDYSHGDYSTLQNIFMNADSSNTVVDFTPEFTNSLTAELSFGVYSYIHLADGNDYTLMAIFQSSIVDELFSYKGNYDELSTVIVDSNGKYIIRNLDFKGEDLFDYIYTYNGLTLDQKNEILNEFKEKDGGYFIYDDSLNQKSIFSYSKIEEKDWYCVTVVPIESFHSSRSDLSYVFILVSFFIVLLAFDITILLYSNNKLKQSIIKETKANDAKTDFLSRVSHDIRTPLNGIIGTTYLALGENDEKAIREYLELINSNGKFLLGLINDILDMSKVESGKMELNLEPYSYESFKNDICAVIKPLCQNKGVRFIMTDPVDLNIYVRVDIIRFNQVFLNLLSNAVKFTPKCGTIEFSISNEKIDEDTISSTFIVKDTGIGMSEEFQKHMFEPFSQEGRISQNIDGTGLGLSIVSNIVKMMKGEINVESVVDKGTTFYVNFILKTVDRHGKKKLEVEGNDLSVLEGKKVLLCEDNFVNVMIAKKILEKNQMIVDVANNGLEGVEKFSKSEEFYYDCVLMDIMMPKLDGLKATEQIRELNRKDAKEVPIIALTANDFEADVKNCLNAGMNAHLSKPLEVEKMYAQLIKHIKK